MKKQTVDKISKIILHCSANGPGSRIGAYEIRKYHTLPESQGGRGWEDIGYHYVIKRGGRALAMAAEPAIAYGADKALGALLGMFQRGKDSNLHTPVWAAQHFTASMPQIEDWYRQAYGGLIGEMERSK